MLANAGAGGGCIGPAPSGGGDIAIDNCSAAGMRWALAATQQIQDVHDVPGTASHGS